MPYKSLQLKDKSIEELLLDLKRNTIAEYKQHCYPTYSNMIEQEIIDRFKRLKEAEDDYTIILEFMYLHYVRNATFERIKIEEIHPDWGFRIEEVEGDD